MFYIYNSKFCATTEGFARNDKVMTILDIFVRVDASCIPVRCLLSPWSDFAVFSWVERISLAAVANDFCLKAGPQVEVKCWRHEVHGAVSAAGEDVCQISSMVEGQLFSWWAVDTRSPVPEGFLQSQRLRKLCLCRTRLRDKRKWFETGNIVQKNRFLYEKAFCRMVTYFFIPCTSSNYCIATWFRLANFLLLTALLLLLLLLPSHPIITQLRFWYGMFCLPLPPFQLCLVWHALFSRTLFPYFPPSLLSLVWHVLSPLSFSPCLLLLAWHMLCPPNALKNLSMLIKEIDLPFFSRLSGE